jgi:transcriptional regulator with XRE-family HTH domain
MSLKMLDKNQNKSYNFLLASDLSKVGNKMEKNEFSQRIRELRRQRNLSQAELGKIVGLHVTHIGRYERGTSRPSADALKRLAETLGVTTDYLIEGKSNEVAKAKLEDKDLLDMFREVEVFTEEEKFVVKKILDALITKRKLQGLASS